MARRKCGLWIVSKPLDIMCAMQDALALLQCSGKPVAEPTPYTATGLWLRQAYRMLSPPIEPLVALSVHETEQDNCLGVL